MNAPEKSRDDFGAASVRRCPTMGERKWGCTEDEGHAGPCVFGERPAALLQDSLLRALREAEEAADKLGAVDVCIDLRDLIVDVEANRV